MKKRALIIVIIVVALMVSSSAIAQTSEHTQAGSDSTKGIAKIYSPGEGIMKIYSPGEGIAKIYSGGEGMHKDCSQMGYCKKEFFLCCKEELELTDEQVKSLKSIKMDFMKADIQKEADLKVADLELEELMSADKLDMATVEKMIKSIHSMKAEKKIAHLKAFEKAKGLLTPEQLKKKKEHHQKMTKGM